MAYAENTEVAVEKSIGEIVSLIKKAGANRIAQAEEPEYMAIQFFLNDRMLRFRVNMPALEQMPGWADGGRDGAAANRGCLHHRQAADAPSPADI